MLTNKARYARKYGASAERCCFRRASSSLGALKPVASSPRRAPHASLDPEPTEALKVAFRVASMPDREARDRYHELVDKSIDQRLSTLESFELERIETRLDAEDRDAALDADNLRWDFERQELIQGIEALVRKLKR